MSRPFLFPSFLLYRRGEVSSPIGVGRPNPYEVNLLLSHAPVFPFSGFPVFLFSASPRCFYHVLREPIN